MKSQLTPGVSEEVANRAFRAAESHPLHQEATNWSYCARDVFLWSKSSFDRTRLTDGDKERIQSAMTDCDTALMVSFFTSSKEPEPLAGAGKHYVFLVHPVTFVVFFANVGAWRS